MAGAYSLELSEPSLSHCDCCNGLTVALTRFVYREGDAFAVTYVRYANNHASNELAMLVSLGPWGEGADEADRVAFYCRVRPTEDAYEVMLGDAAGSVWGEVGIVGAKLSRDEARAHPWKATAFEVLDHAFAHDPSLKGFLARAQCGDIAVPLEHGYGMPDVIFALGKDRERRAVVGRVFASLDERRFFLRCLLPIPVEGYGKWSAGVWIEVTKKDFDRARAVWDDAEAYPALKLAGTIANDLAKDTELPVPLGTRVSLHVTEVSEPPKVRSADEPAVNVLLTDTWSRGSFEKYAVKRGYL